MPDAAADPTRQLLDRRTARGSRPAAAGRDAGDSIGPRYFETIGVPAGARPALRRASTARRARCRRSSTSDSRRCTFPARIRSAGASSWPPTAPAPPGPAAGVGDRSSASSPNVRQRIRHRSRSPIRSSTCRSAPSRRASTALLIRAAARRRPASRSLLREEVRAIDPDLPLFDIRTMDQQLAQQRWAFRIFGSMFAIFAVIALVLSAVGPLRGHRLLGVAADAGDRRADGARRAGRRRCCG